VLKAKSLFGAAPGRGRARSDLSAVSAGVDLCNDSDEVAFLRQQLDTQATALVGLHERTAQLQEECRCPRVHLGASEDARRRAEHQVMLLQAPQHAGCAHGRMICYVACQFKAVSTSPPLPAHLLPVPAPPADNAAACELYALLQHGMHALMVREWMFLPVREDASKAARTVPAPARANTADDAVTMAP
jgi:hypothetical protein